MKNQFAPSAKGIMLDRPEAGDIVTVKVKPKPVAKPDHQVAGFGAILLDRADIDEAYNAQHYRHTSIFEVLAVNGGQAVVKRLTGYSVGTVEVWPISLHYWFEAKELFDAMPKAEKTA